MYIFIHTCTCMHMYVTIIIKGTKAINLRGEWEVIEEA